MPLVGGTASLRTALLVPLLCAGLLVRKTARPGGRRLLALLDQAGIGVACTDLAGRLLLLSASTARMRGVPPRWAAGRAYTELLHPGEHEAARMRFHRLVQSGEPFEMVHRMPRSDGREVWAHATALLLRHPNGRPRSVAVVLRDITAQRAAAQEAASRAEALAAERDRMAQGLRSSYRLEALGQLAGGVAHDFNNVLQAVAGGARLIQRHADDPATVLRLSKLVVEAADRGAAVTHRLLAFARRGPLDPGPVDVAGLLAGLRDVLDRILGSAVMVRIEAAPGLPAVLADAEKLELVLVNLATNARDAIVGHGTLTLRATASGRAVRIDAIDDGAGMTAAELQQASEPFFTTKPLGQGTGLGLAMARSFAEQSGGSFAIESAPGQGTVVSLWLPEAPHA